MKDKLSDGCHDLHAIWYLDEVTPGNVLRPDNARKFWAVYVSFRQYGTTALSKEALWMVAGVIRTKTASEVRGGISAIMRQLMRSFFLTHKLCQMWRCHRCRQTNVAV